MSHRKFWTTAFWALPASILSLALLAEPRANVAGSRALEPLSPKLLDRLETRLSRQLREPGIQIQQGADPDVVEGGYTAGYDGRNDPWNDVLQVSRPDNPLVSEACRESARARILDNAADRASMLYHLQAQVALWHQVRQGARHLRLSEILLHLADCRDGCAAYMSGILSCHIGGVRNRVRTVVYFDAGRPRSYEEHDFFFSGRDELRIKNFAREALAEDKDVVLFSRASGAAAFDRHNISGNNALAWRRARMVDRLLTASGVSRDRIRWKVLAWETPRLAASDVATAYGFLEDWKRMVDKGSMDRSVVLVAY